MKSPVIIGLCLVGVCFALLVSFFQLSASPRLTPPAAWHFQFSEVRAFQLNWKDEYSMDSIVQDSGLNDTRFPTDGIQLSDDQVELLRHAILKDDSGGGVIGMCRYPHHAFVFYSDNGEVVGHYDLCFLCSNAGGSPEGFSTYPDYDSLKNLVVDLGMPIANPDWD